MKNSLLSFRFKMTSALIIITAIVLNVNGQKTGASSQVYDDNPNRDQIPQWYLEQIQGSTKAPSVVVTDADNFDNFYLGVDFAESHISVNPTDPTEFFTTYNTDATHSTQDGHDWNNATAVSWGTTIRGDVLSAYDGYGRLYYENMYGSPSILGCLVARSTNNGASWSSPVTAISGVDKNWMAVDQSTGGPYSGYLYTVMTTSSGGAFARSTNNGVSFSTTFTPSTQSLPGMMVCVGPNGTTDGGSVYVVTNGGSSTASTYTFYRSTNGGASFSLMSSQNFAGYVGTWVNSRHSVENMRTRPYPFIAADNSDGPYRGRLYLVYASNTPAGSGNYPSIWCRYSTNGGTTWSSAYRVNDDTDYLTNHHWAPAIWCDAVTGRLYIHWMDTRGDSGDDEALIYATYSDNGGTSFATNQAISNEKMLINCTTCGGGGTPRYQGDYTSIVSHGGVSMSAWSDFRDGTFASYTAYFPDYAMAVSPPSKSPEGANIITAEVPDVKLYTDDVIFSATVQTPASGSFIVNFPSGNTLSSFPGSVPIEIVDVNVPAGTYTVTVTGEGPDGTPVHKREVDITVAASGPNTWTGAFNTYWHNSNNWSAGHIPLAGEDVLLTNSGWQPIRVNFYSESCNSLTINPGVEMEVYGYTLDVAGELENNGTIKFLDASGIVNTGGFTNAAGSVEMTNGSFNVTELTDPGLNGTWIVNGGSIVLNQTTGYPDISANLTMTNGSLKISDPTSSCIFGYGGSATLNLSGGILDIVSTGITISSSYSVTENISGGTIRTTGYLNISNAGFTPIGGTIELYGSNDKYVTQSNGSIYNLTFDAAGAKSSALIPEISKDRDGNIIKAPLSNTLYLTTDVTVNGDLNLLSGTFYPNGHTLTTLADFYVYGTFLMNNAADVVNIGTSYGALYLLNGSTTLLTDGELNMYYAIFSDPGASLSALTPNVINFVNGASAYGMLLLEPASLATVNFNSTVGTGYLQECVDLTINNFNQAAGTSAYFYGGSNVEINNFTQGASSYLGFYGTSSASSVSVNPGLQSSNFSSLKGISSPDAVPAVVFNSNVLINGIFEVPLGSVTAHGLFESATGSEINVSGGSILCDFSLGSGWNALVGLTALSSGSLSFNDASLQIYNSIITGGLLEVGRSLYAVGSGVFTPSGGTVAFVGGSSSGNYCRVNASNGNYFNDLEVNRSNSYAFYTGTPVQINGDFTINSGSISGGNNEITVGGAWTNNVGTSGFSPATSTVVFNQSGLIQYVYGNNEFYNVRQDYNAPGSNLQFIDMNNVQMDMVLNHFTWINDVFNVQGTLDLSNTASKFTANNGGVGTITNLIQGGIMFANGGDIDILDVAEPGIYGTLTVKLGGTLNYFQDASQYPDINASIEIVDGTLSVSGGTAGCVMGYDAPASLTMSGGEFSILGNNVSLDAVDFTENITGGTIIVDQGFFASSPAFTPTGGTLRMIGGYDGNLANDVGANFFNVIIDKTGAKGSTTQYKDREGNLIEAIMANTITLASNIDVFGTFTMDNGTFDMNGYTMNVDGNININDGGHFMASSGSQLAIGSGAILYVNSNGYFGINSATVTHHTSGYYGFRVGTDGTIGAQNSTFEYMDFLGVYLLPGSLVESTASFDGCTFRQGQAAGGSSLITLNGDHYFTANNVNFPTNTWGSSYNVWKSPGTGGGVNFVNAFGGFDGQAFEWDPESRVGWTDGNLSLDINVMLEGPYNSGTGLMSTALLTGGYIPLNQPFNPSLPYYGNASPDWLYAGSESVGSIPANVVDWVYVQLRDASAAADASSATILDEKAAFLLNNGDIVDLDGVSPLSFTGASFSSNLFVVVYQRNHLGVMSNYPLIEGGGTFTYGFSSAVDRAYGGANGHKLIDTGVWGMISSDGNANGLIQNTDETAVWKTDLGNSGYLGGDFDLNGLTQNTDETNYWKVNLGGGGQVPAKSNEGYQSQIPK
ncbi:MAG: exo-alpha-sialidase [Bacteroidales bacterium]|nr:exo-alpha-sialidase [Bacteroidales bacterium]